MDANEYGLHWNFFFTLFATNMVLGCTRHLSQQTCLLAGEFLHHSSELAYGIHIHRLSCNLASEDLSAGAYLKPLMTAVSQTWQVHLQKQASLRTALSHPQPLQRVQ